MLARSVHTALAALLLVATVVVQACCCNARVLAEAGAQETGHSCCGPAAKCDTPDQQVHPADTCACAVSPAAPRDKAPRVADTIPVHVPVGLPTATLAALVTSAPAPCPPQTAQRVPRTPTHIAVCSWLC